jgi:hypothetical protein
MTAWWPDVGVGVGLGIYVLFRLVALPDFLIHVDEFLPLAGLHFFGRSASSVKDIVALSRGYTYPPLQFLVSLPLSSWADDLRWTMFLFRLPSLVLWLGGIALLWKVLRGLWPETERVRLAVPVALALVSTRGFVESSQGYNYASVVLIGAIMAWTLTDQGFRRITTNLWWSGGTGIALGCLVWLSYQTVFLAGAAFVAMMLPALTARNWGEVKRVVGIIGGFAVPTLVVAVLCLRPAMAHASGTPDWARGLPGDSTIGQFVFPFGAWLEVLQNVLTMVPWGTGSLAVAAIGAVVILWGACRAVRGPRPPADRARLWIFLGTVAAGFTVGPYLNLFPLGGTRHTFVLQVPVLLALAAGLAELRFGPRTLKVALAAICVAGAISLPGLVERTRYHVDFALLESLIHGNPGSRVVDLPGAFTWEHSYLAKSDPSARSRLQWHIWLEGDAGVADYLAGTPVSFAISNSGPMTPAMWKLLAERGKTIEELRAIPPTGSNELSSHYRSGENGFYLYRITSESRPRGRGAAGGDRTGRSEGTTRATTSS